MSHAGPVQTTVGIFTLIAAASVIVSGLIALGALGVVAWCGLLILKLGDAALRVCRRRVLRS